MSRVVRKEACPKCQEVGNDKSGDNLVIYGGDGGGYCFACNYTLPSKERKRNKEHLEDGIEADVLVDTSRMISKEQIRQIIDLTSSKGVTKSGKNIRGIREDTNKFFGVRYEYDQGTGEPVKQYYPCTLKGSPSGYKIREFPKSFGKLKGVNSSSCEMFGQIRFEVGAHRPYVLITGGEVDALSAYQMLEDNAVKAGYDSSRYAVVSPTIGEKCSRQVQNNYKFFDKFERIYIGLDNDRTGREATEDLVKVLPKGKVYVVNWDLKDPNDMLVNKKARRFISNLFEAKRFAPRGLVGSANLYDRIVASAGVEKLKLPPFMHKLQRMLAGGIPLGQIVNIAGASGSGKCLGKDTPVLMYDGSVKPVQDIQKGEQIMGDDGTPRNVLSTCTGREPLYRVKQIKGMDYVVNESHILSLRVGTNRYGWEKGDIVDISVKDYLSGSNFKRSILKGYKGHCLNMDNKLSNWEPYMLGLWLADGTTAKPQITFNKKDVELLQELDRFCDRNGYRQNISPSCDKENMVTIDVTGGLLVKLRDDLGVLNNKHIPDSYLYGCKEDRRQLLAGILDGDGHKSGNCCVDFIQKKGKFVDQLVFLCRSLGLHVKVTDKFCKCQNFEGAWYTRLSITGHIDEIPHKVERKQHGVRCQEKQVGSTGIKLEPLGEGDYYGFEIDGNRRFMLEDFTVTHNTSVVNELIYHWIFNSPHYMGIVSMELDAGQFGEVILSRHVKRKIALIEEEEEKLKYLKSEEVKGKAQEVFLDEKGQDRFMLVDDRDGTIQDMQAKVEELVIAYGCKIIVLDPIQDILDGLGNEDQATFLRWQKQMIASHMITFVNINHVRKSTTGGRQNSAGADLTEEDMQGSSTLFKSGAVNIMIMRNKYAEDEVDRNTMRVRISKCRWSGHTGDGGEWYYENNTHTFYDKEFYFDETNPEAWEASLKRTEDEGIH